MTLVLHTPEEELRIERVRRLRFETDDGHRGVLPGHEPALALLQEGPLHVVTEGERGEEIEQHIAAEEGLVTIRQDEVHVVTRWAAQAPTLELLLAMVERRSAARRRIEDEARAFGHRHELALQRALLRLRRDPHQ
ncbi:MAG: hypothetical protein IPK80_18080 [Nannocystis sp.]|jgi:F0F1-type ATP synthase epsilon subunit|nr:hypothetical protein [Nannocystis sp.]